MGKLPRIKILYICEIIINSFYNLLTFTFFFSPTVRENWTEEAFRWTLLEPNELIAGKSFSLFGALANRIEGRQIIALTIATLDSMLNSDNTKSKRFSIFLDELLHLIEQNWFLFDLKAFESVTAIAIVLIQSGVKKLYAIALKLLRALYKGNNNLNHSNSNTTNTSNTTLTSNNSTSDTNLDNNLSSSCTTRHSYFKHVLPFINDLWFDKFNASNTDYQTPKDQLITHYLFPGLHNPDIMEESLWLFELCFHSLSNTLLLSNYLLVTTLLVHHVLCIENPKRAIDSFHSIKEIGKDSFYLLIYFL